MEQWLSWGYVAIMLAGALCFLRWSRTPKGLPSILYRLPVVVVTWSGLWHAVIALHLGSSEVAGRSVSWARYLDWLVTVPLLVTALVFTATHASHQKRYGLMATLAGANFLMVLCGLAADWSADRATRLTLYGVGTFILAIVVVLIRGPLWATALRQPPEMAAHFRAAATLLGAAWVTFPAVWILGPPGFGYLGEHASAVIFLVLSVLMKLGWSLFDVGRLRGLADRQKVTLR